MQSRSSFIGSGKCCGACRVAVCTALLCGASGQPTHLWSKCPATHQCQSYMALTAQSVELSGGVAGITAGLQHAGSTPFSSANVGCCNGPTATPLAPARARVPCPTRCCMSRPALSTLLFTAPRCPHVLAPAAARLPHQHHTHAPPANNPPTHHNPPHIVPPQPPLRGHLAHQAESLKLKEAHHNVQQPAAACTG